MISKKKQLFIFNLIFILFFLYTSTISAFAQAQTYTITINCSGLKPIILSSDGTEIGFDQLSNNVKFDLLTWFKEGITEGEFIDETHRNLILLMLKEKHHLSCTIPNNQTNIIGGVDETPATSTPLKFTPEVGIPGFIGEKDVEGGFLLGNFLVALYKYLISLSGAVVVIILILGGFEWVFAGGDRGKISKAKERIKNAFIGMTLVSCSYLILYTINPAMLNIVPIKVDYVEPVGIQDTSAIGPVPSFLVSAPDMSSGGKCPQYKTSSDWQTSVWQLCPKMGVISGASCTTDQIVAIAKQFEGCVNGPCHCACFTSSVLYSAGCFTDEELNRFWNQSKRNTSLPTRVVDLQALLKSHAISKKWEIEYWQKQDITRNPPMAGDLILQTDSQASHVAISTGYPNTIESSSEKSYGNIHESTWNPPPLNLYWHSGPKTYSVCNTTQKIKNAKFKGVRKLIHPSRVN